MKIVLYQPEIPQNTGNIGRLCVATDTELILVKPLGFFIGDKEIRRSGLDYWKDLKLKEVNSLEEIYSENPDSRFLYLSTKGKKSYTQEEFRENDILVLVLKGLDYPLLFLKNIRSKFSLSPCGDPYAALIWQAPQESCFMKPIDS